MYPQDHLSVILLVFVLKLLVISIDPEEGDSGHREFDPCTFVLEESLALYYDYYRHR